MVTFTTLARKKHYMDIIANNYNLELPESAKTLFVFEALLLELTFSGLVLQPSTELIKEKK